MIWIHPSVCFLLGALLLVLPLNWLLASVFAAVLHEFAHAAVCVLSGGRIDGVDIGLGGARIYAVFPGKLQECICAAAGPAASLLLIAVCQFAPEVSICGAIQGVFNLLPIYPMDGGRILRCLLEWIFPEKADRILRRIGYLTAVVLALLLLIAAILRILGLFPFLCCTILILRALPGKIPCKTA